VSNWEKVDKWFRNLFLSQIEKDQLRLEKHMRKFRCHICTKPSKGPCEDQSKPGKYYWNQPKGLFQCSECGKWACLNHIHNDEVGNLICSSHVKKPEGE
jgi:hypothetical protein